MIIFSWKTILLVRSNPNAQRILQFYNLKRAFLKGEKSYPAAVAPRSSIIIEIEHILCSFLETIIPATHIFLYIVHVSRIRIQISLYYRLRNTHRVQSVQTLKWYAYRCSTEFPYRKLSRISKKTHDFLPISSPPSFVHRGWGFRSVC